MEDDGRMSEDEGYAIRAGWDRGESAGDPDLQLDVPTLSVEEIDLEVEDLQVRLSIQAELADLVKIKVGLDAELGELKLGIKGVQAQLQLKARLDNVRAIFSEVLASLEHNPRFFREPVSTEALRRLGPVDRRRRGTSRRTESDGSGHEEGEGAGCGPLRPRRHGRRRTHRRQGRHTGRGGMT